MKHPSDFPTLSSHRHAPLIITPQGRQGRFLVGKTATVVTSLVRRAVAATAFYLSKSRQDLNLGGLAYQCHGSPTPS